MFDDLRQSADFQEEQERKQKPAPQRPVRRKTSQRQFLGMTPPQRFVVSLMLFIMTVLFGAFCLLVTGRIILPF